MFIIYGYWGTEELSDFMALKSPPPSQRQRTKSLPPRGPCNQILPPPPLSAYTQIFAPPPDSSAIPDGHK